MDSHEFKHRTVSANEEIGSPSGSQDRDVADLARVGKKSVLKRTFGVLSTLGFSCTILATWEGLFNVFLMPLQNGGPGGVVYTYIFAWSGTACCFVVLSELASMAPTSGGQYHWCAMLAPPKYMKFLSYMTGWLAVIGWQAAFASSSFIAGTQIQGAVILAHKYYQPEPWHGTLIMWAAVFLALGINLVGGKVLPRLETLILVIHILGFFGVLIPLTYMSEKKTREEVFDTWVNSGQWPTQGLSWFVGMTGCVFAFAGGDAAVHMAEEVKDASVALPRSILLSVLLNGTLGFSMLIAALFCMGDLEAALSTSTGYPYMQIFYQATDSISGALGMTSILLIIAVCTVIGMLAATSRQFWSFSRDRAVPGWRIWSKVSAGNHLPTFAILLTMTVCCLLGLINIGSSVVLNGVTSMAVSGMYLSYLMVGSLLLWRRCTGAISPHDHSEDGIVNVPGAKLAWGPFRVPGTVGTAINAYAIIYMIIVIFFSFWPTQMEVDRTTMNFSVVGTIGTIILALIYYLLRARKVYQGPIIEVAR
ncbi:putative GABA permease [Aspergillus clavatus NRRL 1]|uniref:Amino acid permease, putative n=1 Tax=Aspergillus clavatus (strain ATCC 1007 / CBS 513.65 / DSM 816 / NCTC 3887 / NRRL 1 / QM 1276 / 107) TaxID=344612 RepID=A1CC24_ASPCL|nr:amino acid permease, putative [Aspergillus clavatus NRRL 1]EAW13292.1 amino acid permease, putative [Aspergillus clavatus NRRL 1]